MAEYDIPKDCLYTREDEWVRIDSDRATIGVTDYAQDKLGDIVFVELPDAGASISQGEAFGVIESVKAVSDLFAPISGQILESNDELGEAPDMINTSCYADGWLLAVNIGDPSEIDSLLSPDDYLQYIKDRED